MSSDDQNSRENRDQTNSSADEPERETEDVESDSPDESAGGGGEEPVAEVTDAPSEDREPSEPQGETPATFYDDPYDEYEYNYEEPSSETSTAVTTPQPEPAKSPPPPPPPVDTEEDGDDDEEEGMARMSFLEHLEELRTRIIRALLGLIVAYSVALAGKSYLFKFMREPFDAAVATIRANSPDANIQLVALTPIEQFHLIWLKIPIVAALFMAAPWWMYQAWAFISPGLYRKERRWATPFIMSGSVLFILGGLFGYFVALKFALAFLLNVGGEEGVVPLISINSYYSMFVSIMLGLGVVFQMPIAIFILTALRIASPGFLMNNVRYAILIIFILAAVITPTPDIFNMITFAAPMIMLFYVGIFFSYLFLLKREGKSLPWSKILIATLIVLAIIAGIFYYAYAELGYHFVSRFPWFVGPGG